MDLVPQPSVHSGLTPIKRPTVLSKHPNWPEIHADCATSPLTAIEICRKHDIKFESGVYAVYAVTKYRAALHEQHKELFAKAGELELELLRREATEKLRHVYDLAEEGHELAKSQTKKSGRGKDAPTVPNPNFMAMKMQQDTMLTAAEKLGAVVGGAREKQGTQPPANPTTINIMAIPKSEGVPTRAPVRVIDARTA